MSDGRRRQDIGLEDEKNVKREPQPPFADTPPRLMIAINRVIVEPNRTLPDTSPGATVPANSAGRDPILDASGGNYVTSILDFIAQGLAKNLDAAWETDAARTDVFPATDEEKWARKVAELFTGLAYAGPDVIANFPSFNKTDPPKAARPYYPVAYIYQRFQMKYAARADFCMAKLPSEAPLTENSDPAYSLSSACQHLATYIVLSRGFTVEADMLGCGLSAASNQKLPIFTADKGGKWINYDDTKKSTMLSEAFRAP